MDNITYFSNNQLYQFNKYSNITDLKDITDTNLLYIFNAFCYDENISVILPENSFKIGKTDATLYKRLSQYNPHVNTGVIECIQCTYPGKREHLLKTFLKEKTNIRPVCGQEYFKDCKDYIKYLILIVVSLPEEEVILYY